MMIRVMYDDGQFDMVKPQLLDRLLEARRVTSFRRATGWAVVGRDPVRSRGRSSDYYQGPERRLS